MSIKQQKQTGFTLIELIVVVIILGILAATALPRMFDFSGDAHQAAIEGFAGAIDGGNSINFATYLARRSVIDGSAATPGVVDTRDGCDDGLALLQEPLPDDYEIAGSSSTNQTALGMNVNSTDCVVRLKDDNTVNAPFRVTGTY